jgi:hypothetical protein
MAYIIINAESGLFPIASTDAGFIPPGNVNTGSTTAVPSPPATLGKIVRAVDPTYGEGEFICLAGVASTAVGSVVTYNTTSYTTTLSAVGGNVPGPVAIAMSANTSASTYGWYQISGVAVVKKTCTVSLAAGAAVGVLTTGLIAGTGTGKEIEGAIVAAVASATAGRTTVSVLIARPTKQGRIT